MKIRPFLALLVLLITPCRAAEDPGIQLMGGREILQPGRTLEFRFDTPMVGPDQLGPSTAPVVFDPAWPGTFAWLSTRSGVFVPTEAPPLGVKFVIRAREGLKNFAGNPVGSRFRAEVSTPPFEAVAASKSQVIGNEAQPNTSATFIFNLRVSLDHAAQLFRFRDASGASVPAEVSYPRAQEDMGGPKPGEEDWERRWQEAIRPSAPQAGALDSKEIKNRLLISPARPLPVGEGWKLEMSPGLRSLDGKIVTQIPYELPLGNVSPLRLKSLLATHYIHSGCGLVMDFSGEIAPDITPQSAGKFFRITPAVENLRFEMAWRQCLVSGDFEVGKDYELHVGEGVVSDNGVPFAGDRTVKFRFAPVPPRLYLPEITGHQILGGRRIFEIESVNLQSIQVEARAVDPASAARAVAAFEKYPRTDFQQGEMDETYQALPPDAIAGRELPGETFRLPAPRRDAKQMTGLDWTKILGGKKAGTIFLTVTGDPLEGIPSKRPAAQALIQLTDLGVLWKTPGDRLAVHVFSMASGAPAAGAAAVLLDSAFQPMSSGVADASGDISLARGIEPAWLVVSKGDDCHVLKIGEGAKELPMAAFHVPVRYSGWNTPPDAPDTVRSMIFTDRPIYRPGEMVRIKGIVRKDGGPSAVPAEGLPGELTISNRGEEIEKIPVVTDGRGAFDSSWQIRPGLFGHVRFELKLDGIEQTWPEAPAECEVEVADFQPDAFEVNVALPNRLPPSKPVAADVTAGYLFGAPLTAADVRWTLQYAGAGFSPEGFEHFQFGDETRSDPTTLRGEGRLAAGKPFVIEPQLPDLANGRARGALTVEVTDLNQQTVSCERPFVRDSSDFYLGIESADYVFKAGTPVPVRVIAVGPDSVPLKDSVEISAVLTRDRNDVVRVLGAGGAISFRTNKVEEKIGEAKGRTVIPKRENGGWAVLDESMSFAPKEPGSYNVRVTAKDRGGRRVTSLRSFSVAGPGDFVWDYRNPAQVDLVPDKAEYRPGDVAKVLIKTPIAGEALVTVERGTKILRSFRAKLEGNAPLIEVPLSADDAPDVFVSMVLIRGADESMRKFKMPEYKYGLCVLRIADPRADMRVEIAPQKKEYQPGQEVVADISVRDGLGAPVRDAEVTFFAVDDGILNLTGYTRPAPSGIFNALVPLKIRTGLSLFELMPEDPTDLEFGNKGYLIGGGGEDGTGRKLRENFPGTACWLPSLHTGADGHVSARFAAPDALTRYRIVAVAHARGTLFGSGESSISIIKPLMILPSTGQFANSGDTLIARAVVRNETRADGTVEVVLETGEGAETPGGHTARIDVPAGQARAVDFPVRFVAVGTASWTWSASMKSGEETLQDTVRSTFPVGSPMLALRETNLQDLRQPTNNLFAGINPQLLEGTGSVAITLSNTRLASLRESVNALLEYPYGCAEQTTSALIPWIVLPSLRPVLAGFPSDEKETRKVVETGVAKLLSMQTDSGGLAFWPGGREPSIFASAWATVAMARLKAEDFPMPPGYPGLLEFLARSLRGGRDKQASLTDQALIVYALSLAGQPEASRHALLFEKRAELPRESRALLALAILEAGGPAPMVKDLLNPKSRAPEDASPFGGASRDRAIQLLAWSSFQPQSNETSRLVKELLASGKKGRMGSTQDNAWALLAIENYFRKSEAAGRDGKPVEGTLTCGRAEVPFRLTSDAPALSRSFPVAPGTASAQVANPSKGQLFGETTFAVYPPLGDQPRQDRGYSVSRRYSKIGADGAPEPANGLKVGDRVLVTLRIESSLPGSFVAIDDPLPSILEAVNPEFKSRSTGEGAVSDGRSDYREIRADRVVYFCNQLPAGAFVFQYLARVRAAGEACAPATNVGEMYRPERFGLGTIDRISSAPATVP